MLNLLLSRTGMTFVLIAVLALALGAQSMRLRSRTVELTVATAAVAVCNADNARLQGEVQQGIDAIEAQNNAILILKADADKANAKAAEAVKVALKASQRDVRRPADVGTLNARLRDLF